MKKTVIKYMVPKEVIFEDGEDLGKRIVETAKQLGADTYHHVKMIDEEEQETGQRYYQIVVERDYVGHGLIWILASSQDEAIEIAKKHGDFEIFTAENMDMVDVGNSDRYAGSLRSLSQDEMPDFIYSSRAMGEEVFLDQNVIDRE